MAAKPVIFISAVSKELRSTRDLVAKVLLSLGYDPVWQDLFGLEDGTVKEMLRRKIDASDGLIQLVGHSYGAESQTPDADFGRVSYTQYEALYARQQKKRVWYLLLEDTFPADAHEPESEEQRQMQLAYRQRLQSEDHLFHNLVSSTDIELRLMKLRDELSYLRRKGKQWAALVLSLLIVLVLGIVWLKHDLWQQTQANTETKAVINKLQDQNDKLLQSQADLRQQFDRLIKGGSKTKLTSDYDAALRFIAQKRGIDLAQFRRYLAENATQALGDNHVSLSGKVRALKEDGQFVQSRDFALEQARRLESERRKNSQEEVQLWTEAAKIEHALGNYEKSLEYATKAVNEADPHGDFAAWAAARHQQGWALIRLRKDKEAQRLYEEFIPLLITAFGPDNLTVLQSRRMLTVSVFGQGHYVQAEQLDRALVVDCQRVLGADDPEVLMNRNKLAEVMRAQGKDAEAEIEHRTVLKIQERVLGEEHPNTLMSRVGLAYSLGAQKKYEEAVGEYRLVLQIQQRMLGADHPDTLKTRMDLVAALDAGGKHAEAETEEREVLSVQERVLGAEHPDVALSCYNLALCLKAQMKLPEALTFMKRAEQVRTKVVGPDHPISKEAKAARERIEAAMKAQ